MQERIKLVSVVIPARNEEKGIAACLDSIKNQDYRGDFEIIVADNGSQDQTAEIARRSGARIVICGEQAGVFYAREQGARAALGEVIVQGDADTVYPKQWLGRIVRQFERHPAAVAVAGRFLYLDPPWWAGLEYGLRHLINLIGVLLWRLPPFISGATFAFRRANFAALGGYAGIQYAADQWGIASRLRRAGHIVYDKNIYVLASARRVKKPFPRILCEGTGNVARWAGYLLKDPAMRFGRFATRTRARRVILALVPLLVLLFLLTYGYFIPESHVFGGVYYQGPRYDREAALTSDDGPNRPFASRMSDILKTHDVLFGTPACAKTLPDFEIGPD